MTPSPYKRPDVILVDDHLIFRQGLKSILTLDNIANIIGEASNGIELLELLTHLKPHLVLMDIDMPHMNGMDATKRTLELYPDMKVIAFTMYSDEEYYYRMIEVGVKGFVLKTCGINELEEAIVSVMQGDNYFSNELLRKIIKNFGRSKYDLTNDHEKLTRRETDILQQICLGLTTDEIAKKLFISPKTVKSHKSNLLEKTDCKNTPSLILYAIKNNMVEY
ncbi:MAG: response regulator transcription factor [Paludibacter sp.]|nr:response regulator transcription factor [Paludibacter sp.]